MQTTCCWARRRCGTAQPSQHCFWLLLTLDRLLASEIVMTQELLSSILGVRRASVTEATGNLQEDGLISYQRGLRSVRGKPLPITLVKLR